MHDREQQTTFWGFNSLPQNMCFESVQVYCVCVNNTKLNRMDWSRREENLPVFMSPCLCLCLFVFLFNNQLEHTNIPRRPRSSPFLFFPASEKAALICQVQPTCWEIHFRRSLLLIIWKRNTWRKMRLLHLCQDGQLSTSSSGSLPFCSLLINYSISAVADIEQVYRREIGDFQWLHGRWARVNELENIKRQNIKTKDNVNLISWKLTYNKESFGVVMLLLTHYTFILQRRKWILEL